MPELPEVETIRLGLQKYIVGYTITAVDVRLPEIVSGAVKDVTGAEIIAVRRFGKGLVIDLSNGFSIAIHIKMTGQLIYKGSHSTSHSTLRDEPSHREPEGSSEPRTAGSDSKSSGQAKMSEKVGGKLPNKHTHVIFKLKDQNAKVKAIDQSSKAQDALLYYNDIRQFGWMKIVKTEDVFLLPFFKELGPELFPSSGQQALTLNQFKAILQKAKGPIKPLLMDQKKIGGLGNIYANDALYVAKIDPKRKANMLNADEAERVFEALKKVLAKGLEVGGASEWQYVNALGQAGNYQNFFQVYNQKGKPCRRCGAVIEKIQFGGRGTFYCPACQR